MELSKSCNECGDDGSLYVSGRCHLAEPLWAVLTGDILTLECAKCEQVVTRFRVQAVEES